LAQEDGMAKPVLKMLHVVAKTVLAETNTVVTRVYMGARLYRRFCDECGVQAEGGMCVIALAGYSVQVEEAACDYGSGIRVVAV
jgi:hypothetical protein